MFSIFRRQKSKPYDWKKEHDRLWNALVPPEGQAETLQGELIRIAGKLTDQAFRNGNMNWDAEHEMMWRFVGKHLDDPETFGEEARQLIRDKIEEIIRDNKAPDLSGDGCCYYVISERVVDWCMAHPTPIPHKKDPTLIR
jgi:hypothetical protein